MARILFGRIALLRLLTFVLTAFFGLSAYAESENVTMSVGEVKTLYLPTSVTSKNLRSVTFYSNGISYVQVQSYTNYSVTVKAVKAFSAPIIVRCDYYYFINNGGYTYQTSGFYDFNVTVKDSGTDPSVISPTRIYFPSSVASVEVGETRVLEPVVEPSNATYTLTWSINDTSVATISSNGVLTGKKVGYADLTVRTNNGLYTMLRISVYEPSATSVSVSPTSITLTEGDYKYLTSTVYPLNASQSVTWSSNDTNVATVSSSGKVTAQNAGSCIIKATTSNGRTATCSVTVKAKTISPSSISLPDSINLISGESYLLTPKILPDNATYTLSWSSDNIEIAKVITTGEVFALSSGVANISAKINDSPLAASCVVTVKDQSSDIDYIQKDAFTDIDITDGIIYLPYEEDIILSDISGHIFFEGRTKQIRNVKAGLYILKVKNVARKIYIK